MWRLSDSCWTEAALRLMRRVQRGHDRSFQPYSPMGWRVALRSGRVHKLCQRLRSSGSRYARHRSHIRQLRRARTIRHGPGRASGRANWCGDGPGRPRPTRGRHTRRPGGRVVCTGIDNPGGNVFPASRPVWQWGGTRYNFYLALWLMRRIFMVTHLFTSRAATCGPPKNQTPRRTCGDRQPPATLFPLCCLSHVRRPDPVSQTTCLRLSTGHTIQHTPPPQQHLSAYKPTSGSRWEARCPPSSCW